MRTAIVLVLALCLRTLAAPSCLDVSVGALHVLVNAGGFLSGTGDTIAKQLDVPPSIAGLVLQATAGSIHSCALHRTAPGSPNATISCWGGGSSSAAALPAYVAADPAPRAVGAGVAHTCAILSTGAVACWGLNNYGQVSPIPTGLENVLRLGVGAYHTCAVSTANGAAGLACWGRNDRGQSSDFPAWLARGSLIPTAAENIYVACGGYHCCVWGPTQPPTCWGSDAAKQSSVPAAVATSQITDLCAGGSFTCALISGSVTCWGGDSDALTAVPPIASSGGVASLACSYYTACAVFTAADGTPDYVCWGSIGLAYAGRAGSNSSNAAAAANGTSAGGGSAMKLITKAQTTTGGGASRNVIIRSGAGSSAGPSGAVSLIGDAGVVVTTGGSNAGSGGVVLATGGAANSSAGGVLPAGSLLLSAGGASGAISLSAREIVFGDAARVNVSAWAALAAVAAARWPSPTPTPSLTPSPTPTASPSASLSATASPSLTPSPSYIPPLSVWSPITGAARTWVSASASTTGILQAISVPGEGVYASSDGGASFNMAWASVGGTYLVAATGGGLCVAGVDYADQGVLCSGMDWSWSTWNSGTVGTSGYASALAMSADAQTLLLATTNEYAWVSRGGGGMTTWAPVLNDRPRNFSAAAVSPLGNAMAVAEGNGWLYYSSDGLGERWTPVLNDTQRTWTGVALSHNGSRLAACVDGGLIYLSPAVGGWTPIASNAGVGNYKGIAMSADGAIIFAAIGGGGLRVSKDGGSTWSTAMQDTSRAWSTVALSGNGAKVLAGAPGLLFVGSANPTTLTLRLANAPLNYASFSTCRSGAMVVATSPYGALLRSYDYGSTWEAYALDAPRLWQSAACFAGGELTVAVASSTYGGVYSYIGANTSAAIGATQTTGTTFTTVAGTPDGSLVLAGENGGLLWWRNTSTPLGWSKLAGAPSAATRYWTTIAVSEDGSLIVAAETTNGLWTSTSRGANWTIAVPAARSWSSVALTADGARGFAVTQGGLVATTTDRGASWNITGIVMSSYSWISVACDPLGRLVVLASRTVSPLLVSIDGGVSWEQRLGAENKAWKAVTVSFDPGKNTSFVFAGHAGGIYRSSLNWNPPGTKKGG